MEKKSKTNCQVSQFNIFSKTKLSLQIKVNSWAQSTVYTIFVYFKISKWHIGPMGRV